MTSLSDRHRQLVEASAITPSIAGDRGYRTVEKKAELGRLGFSARQQLVPALLVPVWGVHGDQPVTYQIRPDEPRVVKGKALKYETPRGTRISLDVPPSVREHLSKPNRPLFITEGARKADAGASAGLCTIAVLGVWNWRGTNEWGGKTVLPDWESIALEGRKVYLVFDSDVMEKRPVHLALARLKSFLESRRADVRVVYLPSGEGALKVGLDDYLAASHDVDNLLALAESDLRPMPADERPGSDYAVTPDGATVWNKRTEQGEVTPVTLANFSALITAEIVHDDGAETTRKMELECRVGDEVQTFSIRGDRFTGMGWVTEHLGPGAILEPGIGLKERFRVAVQKLSASSFKRRRVYGHLGWREIDGERVFLHAGGAIGRAGSLGGIDVDLQPPLDLFTLPEPPHGSDLVDAVQRMLVLLDGLAPDHVLFPLFSIAWAAGSELRVDFSIHVFGTTGVRKTSLVAIFQAFFGQDLDPYRLPCSWSSTANYNEELGFLAKDAILAVDDFKPVGTRHDEQRLHKDADRLLRARGNMLGRGRMRADGTVRPARPPRAAFVSTGEDIPAGHSLVARTLLLELRTGEVELSKLTLAQREFRVLSQVMAAFLQWSAARHAPTAAQDELEQLRGPLLDLVAHGRHATTGAVLLFALQRFVQFATECGAIDTDRAEALAARGSRAIRRALAQQQEHLESADPVRQFFDVLSGLLQSGRNHLRDRHTDDIPAVEGEVAERCAKSVGWRLARVESGERDASVRTEWRPGGTAIGWVDVQAEAVYLIPTPAYQAVQAAPQGSSHALRMSARMLWKALEEHGVLASRESDRNTKKIRVGDRTCNALHIDLSLLFDETGTSGTAALPPPDDAAADDEDEDRAGPELESNGNTPEANGNSKGLNGNAIHPTQASGEPLEATRSPVPVVPVPPERESAAASDDSHVARLAKSEVDACVADSEDRAAIASAMPAASEPNDPLRDVPVLAESGGGVVSAGNDAVFDTDLVSGFCSPIDLAMSESDRGPYVACEDDPGCSTADVWRIRERGAKSPTVWSCCRCRPPFARNESVVERVPRSKLGKVETLPTERSRS